MYSGLQMNLANNYNIPQYLYTPVYTIGNFLINPFNLNEFPVFPFTSYCPQSSYLNANQNPSEFASTLASDPNTKIRQMEVKEKSEIQVTPPKKRSSNRKIKKKIMQKDTRNVISNLLKNFFKNLLDLRLWDKFLESLIKKHQICTSLKSFYLWIHNFKINYKNYIKAKEIEFLLKDKDYRDYQLLFRALLKHFIYNEGINHCLTARKIGRTAIARHIEGLRQINNLFVLSEI